MAKKYGQYFLRLFHEPHAKEHLLQRELWVQDVVGLTSVVLLAASAVILAGIAFGLFEFSGTQPIFIALAIMLPGWWIARHGGWRFARYLPGLVCFGLGLYVNLIGGVSPSAGLFYVLAVLVTGMLSSTLARWWMIVASTAAFGVLGGNSAGLPVFEMLPPTITLFFGLVGVAVLQWYYDTRLGQIFSAMLERNQSLQAEIARRERAEQAQREQETALRASESLLRRLADNTTDLITEISLDGTIHYASPSHQAVLGRNPRDMIGRNAFDLTHPDDINLAQAALQRLVREHRPVSERLRARNARGEYQLMETSGSPVIGTDGALTGIVLSSRDVTQQQQAEQQIAESEKKFRNIIESFPLGIHMYQLEPDDRLVLVGYNPAANRIAGIDHAPLIGKTIEEAFPNLAQTQVPDQYRQTARSGTPWNSQALDYSDDQINGCFEVHAFQAAPGMMVTVYDDITERIRTARALRQSEDKFSTAFHTSPDSININRLADGVYVDINEGFTRIMGYATEDVIGKSSLELDIWVDPADRNRLVTGLRATGEVNNLEARFRKKDGTVGIGLMSARIIVIRGETCILSITREITDWIYAQFELRQAHGKLEAAYEATLQGWTNALQLREKETAEHSRRVVDLTVRMAQQLGVCDEALKHVRRGALLHDIGKMGIPDYILLKPGPLTDEEWVIMRQHVEFGYEMIKSIPYLHPSIDIPYSHHERWDGQGYPQGLSGEDIPLGARIFAVADVYDALLSHRPYRPAWPEAEVLRYLHEQSGKQFDPRVVTAFFDHLNT